MPRRSCGTCRDRRILCDRTVPTCLECSRTGRSCKGYGIRLSWPKGNDRKRAMVGKSPRARSISRISGMPLVNASSWDIEMHRHLKGLASDNYTRLVLHSPMPFSPLKLDVKQAYLFQYFQSTASRSLTTFGHEPTSVGNLLVRMALTSTSPSSAAVLASLLALSSLHLFGLQNQAGELKISALKALAAAANTAIGPVEAAQHVAAGMLLCSFEIHRASCTSGQWRCYVSGVNKIIHTSSSIIPDRDSDFNTLLDWVYYHDVLSRFSKLHWRSENDAGIPPACTSEYPLTRAISSTVPGFEITLKLLSDVCHAVATRPPPAAPAEQLNKHHTNIQTLAWRIRNIDISAHREKAANSIECARTAELFQQSMLVYLNRATGNLLEPVHTTEQRVHQALLTFSQLDICERQFPLFIFGCEARTDDERCVVLELIDRTEKSASSRSLFLVKTLIMSTWVQDDLAGGDLDYMDKLSAMISCCTIMPTFV